MKKTRNLLATTLAATLTLGSVVALTSCGDKADFTVGICQLVTHDALDAATKGFKDALQEAMDEAGKTVKFNTQNAAGDTITCNTIVNDFVSSSVDLIMANATPALQAAAQATATIPILGTSVTEYSVALSLDDFDGTVGSNISGTSDLAPLEEQAQMILDWFPDVQTVGMLYCSAEANSAYQVQVVSDFLEAHDVDVTPFAFNDSNDVAAVTTQLANSCDVIYIPTDNTAASCGETIDMICREKQIPVFAGEEGLCRSCGFATLSISYYNLGRKTGEMAARILLDGEDISTMPIEYDAEPVKKFNAEICADLGLTPPEGYDAIE